MSLINHVFTSGGEYLASTPKDNSIVVVLKGGGNVHDPSNIVVTNQIIQYPYPIKLEEGVIVQDTDQVPFEGKWRPAKEVQVMKAEREKSNNGKS